ncbi:patatin-like phospholipase family protein [Pandoraea sp.]|uniref:patatin-like phospholipase family protein n=1 Tax=Pandoraea sp. TaxID=1883445 RepID=UPI001203FAF4|nr:patatin-like phospholipase family protein [Pandoraea sp.]MBU6492646.1 patatin-like phospholipase family protein [Burkholderiales bacterium]MDE2289023.1 patatin-like phospholipase family protein [Burkholderiales bacterium]TAL57210.1 MAG: patatin-like phospholipase family protein [Pandoraea sp.]TAM16542.1 MAG: patatin-like phospholipase family protein [Pandoraea sp.]
MRNKTVTIGLQGGGSHGAFTWGVLDRLLEDGRVDIEGISGASAGAMNAVVLAHGLMLGGRDGARQALKDFWESVATGALPGGIASPGTMPLGDGTQGGAAAAMKAYLFMTRFFSPYQLNPLGMNPLRDILSRQIDFERMRAECAVALFIATTRVSTGTLRLFGTRELTLDVLLASACLPTLHHSIEIDGEAYWDGGLSANPPIAPLLHQCAANDLVLVLLQPSPNRETPASADEISRRLTEISFNTAFSTELRALVQAKWAAERAFFSFGRLDRRLRHFYLHLIDSPAFMSRLHTLSKANTDAAFIAALRDEGRRSAGQWLTRNFARLGSRSTCELDTLLP